MFIPCYDYRIIDEYYNVLMRPKFQFSSNEVNALLDWFIHYGYSVTPIPLNISFIDEEDKNIDEEDKKFYEVAKYCDAQLITGNLKHFPNDPLVISVKQFLAN